MSISLTLNGNTMGPITSTKLARISKSCGSNELFEIPEAIATGHKSCFVIITDQLGREWASKPAQMDFELARLPNATFHFGQQLSVILPPEKFRGREPTGGRGQGLSLELGQLSRLIDSDGIDLLSSGIKVEPAHMRIAVVSSDCLRIERDNADVRESVQIHILEWK